MSVENETRVLSNISVPREITALATYNQGTLPVYLFIGDGSGGLYIYDISRGSGPVGSYKQQQFTISGVNLLAGITGLAVTDQYLFVNSPGNCFQLPMYKFYPTTSYENNLSVVNVGNCYTRDNANAGGIVATPDSRIVFVSFGDSYLSRIFSSDAGSGLVTQAAQIQRQYDAVINGATLDFANTTIYLSDSKNARMFNYNYSTGNMAVLSNPYFIGTRDIEFRGNAYGTYNGTLAYVITNNSGISGVLAVQTESKQDYIIAPQGSLCNTNAIVYDTFGGLYMSTMNRDLSFTIFFHRYIYIPRPSPSVAPPKQQQYECGLFLPGSCKRALIPFNPRERFSWGSPNKPYRTLMDADIRISCPPAYVTVCPEYIPLSTPIITNPPFVPTAVPPPNTGASAQEISRTRNLSTTRVLNLNLQKSLPFSVNISVAASPVLDYRGRLYILGATNGNVYYSDNYGNTTGASVLSNYVGGTFNASPACSLTDRTIAFGSREGILTMFDGSSQTVVWQKNLGTPLDLTPSYYESNVFLGYGSGLNGFSATDGRVTWSAPALLNGDTYSSSTNIQIGNVFVGTQKGTMFVYSLKDASTLFRIPVNTGPILGSPNLGVDNRIYFGSGSNLCAFNLDRTEASTDIVMTTLCGNITTPITLAVDNTRLTRGFFSTDLGASGYIQIDTYLENYPLTNITSNSIPVLDASHVYVVGNTGTVWRYQWNPEPTTIPTSNYSTGATNFTPSVIIDASNQLVIATSNAILTLS